MKFSNSTGDRFNIGYLYSLSSEFYDLRKWMKIWDECEVPSVMESISRNFPNKGVRILDLGCGTAHYIVRLMEVGYYNVYGIDLSEGMLKKACLKLFNSKINSDRTCSRLIQGDAHSLPFEDSSFDLILCTRVFVHINDKKSALREINRILKDNGCALIADIHPDHEMNGVIMKNKKEDLRVAIPTFETWRLEDYESSLEQYSMKMIEYEELGNNSQLSNNHKEVFKLYKAMISVNQSQSQD